MYLPSNGTEINILNNTLSRTIFNKDGKKIYNISIKADVANWIKDNNSLEFKEPFIEKLEDNEIIRFLEIDVPVYCVDVIGDSWAVDEKKDIEVVEKILRK